MVSENTEKLQLNYQAGKNALERGEYRQSVAYLEKATKLSALNSRLGGEIQLWLVNAYQADGMRSEAIALCKQLVVHPSLEIRKQAKGLLYIIEAPKLKRPKEWMTEIPDLAKVETSDSKSQYASANKVKNSNKIKANSNIPESIDLSQVNTKDNQFIWVALLLSILTLAGLFFWHF
ncbi:MAG: tetratricopeptide repeat protein [Xenococcaceae cyanobacterium]